MHLFGIWAMLAEHSTEIKYAKQPRGTKPRIKTGTHESPLIMQLQLMGSVPECLITLSSGTKTGLRPARPSCCWPVLRSRSSDDWSNDLDARCRWCYRRYDIYRLKISRAGIEREWKCIYTHQHASKTMDRQRRSILNQKQQTVGKASHWNRIRQSQGQKKTNETDPTSACSTDNPTETTKKQTKWMQHDECNTAVHIIARRASHIQWYYL